MPGLDELGDRLAEVSARLREAGDAGLVRALSQAIGRAVEPLEQGIREGLPSHMPNRYAAVIDADLKVTRRTFTDPDGARVSVYASTAGGSKRKLRRLNDGVLWHPFFGRFPRGDPRNRWYEMGEPHVRPGWFSGPCEDAQPRAREEIEQALDELAQEAVHG